MASFPLFEKIVHLAILEGEILFFNKEKTNSNMLKMSACEKIE